MTFFFVLTGEIDTRFSFCAIATLALLVCICDKNVSVSEVLIFDGHSSGSQM